MLFKVTQQNCVTVGLAKSCESIIQAETQPGGGRVVCGLHGKGFLFASAPGKVFSKEAIVQAVWNVDYHPLRHDAALFTNIMRLRRLLGEGGDEILRVGEGGYRLVPPADFMFVDKLAS